MTSKHPIRYAAKAFVLTAALASVSAQAVQTAATACLTPADAQAVAVAALPDALTSARRTCLPHLPASAALSRSSSRIAQIYQPAADKAWPKAGRAFMSAVELPLPPGTDPALVRPLLAAAISAMVEQQIKPADCSAIDEFYGALEPLPPENIGKLMIALLKMDESAKKPGQRDANPFKICKDGPQ
jgi:hypothetical protein